ncbi:MAG: aminopeptidase P family protein [Treponema sp.]|nr:aminopeptidase P family protein [Treponema sp.]
MKEYSKEELKKVYQDRRQKIVEYLNLHEIGAAIFIDSEAHRDPSVRYFTGHISDAILIIPAQGNSILIPWDEILAKKIAFCDKIVPYTKYKNQEIPAVKANLFWNTGYGPKIEIPPTTPYPQFLMYVDQLNQWEIRCRENSVHDYAVQLRMVKDEYEIECTKEAARIGDLIINQIEEKIRSGEIKTETDVALLIEKECRLHGCEKTGFDTLAAGPARSWAIHAFPGYTQGEWPGNGLSILDFGVVYNGYTSDTTLTVLKGELSPEQEEIVELVQKAADECLRLYKPGIPVKEACEQAEMIFDRANRKMPHTLGHGIGLEIHEFPRVSTKMPADVTFKPGMIITLEPGLYDEKLGGVRLENDVLITEEGNEVITHSKIIRL